MAKELISFVIPCYCEEEVLPRLFQRLNGMCAGWDSAWEVICIDDGSTDNTWQILTQFQKQNPHWKAISLSRNFGHQAALSAGLWHANGDAVILLDADLQDPPELAAAFITKWHEGHDVVYGIRRRRKEGVFKRSAYWSFYRLLQGTANIDIPLDAGDFCLISRRVVDTMNTMPERQRFLRGLRAWSGFSQFGIPYERSARDAGHSKYSIADLWGLATDGLVSFSGLPLRLAAYVGFSISALAFCGIIFTLMQRLFSERFQSIGLGPVPGFTTIVIAILFLGGIQLIFLGIIGEYLHRIFDEVKRRPQWIIRETAGIEGRPSPS